MSGKLWHAEGWMRAALAGVVAITMALAAGPAFAADDDDDDTWDTKVFRNFLLGLGLQRDGGAGIDYHERSPLVVPPSRELPPPQSAATVTNDPAWPKDRDVAKRKTTKKKQAIPTEEDDMRQLRPDELRGAARGRPTGEAPGVQGARPEQATPSQLGHTGFSLGSMFSRDGKQVQFTGEPPRTNLTEPPPGLRTPSSKYPYGTKGVLEPDKGAPEDRGSYGTNR
jgi:hypothetical protein